VAAQSHQAAALPTTDVLTARRGPQYLRCCGRLALDIGAGAIVRDELVVMEDRGPGLVRGFAIRVSATARAIPRTSHGRTLPGL
jgi:hypothetical protein